MGNEEYEVTEDGKVILTKIPFTGVKKRMAENLVDNWQSAVTVTGSGIFDCTQVVAYRNKLKAEGHKITYTDIFVKLVAYALSKNPMMNASIVGKKIELYKSVNIGVAVAGPNGNLLVPVIRNCEEKSLFEIHDAIKDVSERARNNAMTMEDFMGGTVTVSSMGMFDTYVMTQVVVKPQAVIFGFGAIHDEVVVMEDGTIGIKPRMWVSSSADHRIVQGAAGYQMTADLIEAFKDPEKYMGL